MKNRPQKDDCLIVAVLGLTVVSSINGTIAKAMVSPSKPEVIAALGSAATGGRLAPTPTNR